MPVEVHARFAGTPLDTVVVAAGASYRIGTAAGVELPALGWTSFPIVDDAGRLRVPAGAHAWRVDGGTRTVASGEVVLATPGARLEITLGLVELVVTRAGAVARLPPPPIDARPATYLAAAAAVVLGACIAIAALADPAPPRAAALRLARLEASRAHPAVPRTPMPPARPSRRAPHPRGPASPMAASATSSAAATAQQPPLAPGAGGETGAPPTSGRRRDAANDATFADAMGDLAAGMQRLAGPDWNVAFVGTGSAFDLERYEASQFGGGPMFDPTSDPAYASVAAGRYQTRTYGRGAGDDYHLPGEVLPPATTLPAPAPAPSGPPATGPVELEPCADDACTAAGPITTHDIAGWVAPRLTDLEHCVASAPDGGTTLAFTIDRGGAVRDLRARAATPATRCLASVLASVTFPRNDQPTRVLYPIRYHHAG